MTTSYTTNAMLQKPAPADRNWDVPVNANMDLLDGMTAIGGLLVTTAETPSASLNVRVTGGSYRKADNSIGSYGGTASLAMPASSTTCIWLSDTGVVTTGSAFPSTAHVRLAQVVSGTSSITSVTDVRVPCASAGTGLAPILKAGDTLPDGANYALGSTTGSLIGTTPSQKLAFFGGIPATQAAAVATLNDTTGATAGGTITDVGTTFNQASIDANFASLTAKVNALIAALKRHGLMGS